MDKELKSWFEGFETAVDNMDAGERTKLYCACGKSCVNNGMLGFYQELYAQAGGRLGGMFEKINAMGAVKCEIIESGKSWTMEFKGCECPMYIKGYASSPHMCECFEQSLKFAMETLEPDKKFEVKTLETVLRGSKMCRASIKVL